MIALKLQPLYAGLAAVVFYCGHERQHDAVHGSEMTVRIPCSKNVVGVKTPASQRGCFLLHPSSISLAIRKIVAIMLV